MKNAYSKQELFDIISNSYKFKFIVKSTKKKFPYITDIKIDLEAFNRYELLFLDVYIDPFKLQKFYNKPFKDYFIYFTNLEDDDPSKIEFITDEHHYMLSVIDLDSDEAIKINHDIGNYMYQLSKSTEFPEELTYPADYNFAVHYIYFDPSSFEK